MLLYTGGQRNQQEGGRKANVKVQRRAATFYFTKAAELQDSTNAETCTAARPLKPLVRPGAGISVAPMRHEHTRSRLQYAQSPEWL
jgi:hypothetical protein